MKTSKLTLDTFASEALTQNEMNFLKGGGEPKDLIIPPSSQSKDRG